MRSVPAGDTFAVERGLNKFFAEPIRIARPDPERGGEDTSLVLAFLMRGIKRVIAELRDDHDGSFGVRQLHGVALQTDRRTYSTTTTGFPSTSIFGVMPRPGAVLADMNPFTRCGAPSAVETVT